MRTKHLSTIKGKSIEEDFARAPPASAGASLGEDRTPPLRAPPLHHTLLADCL